MLLDKGPAGGLGRLQCVSGVSASVADGLEVACVDPPGHGVLVGLLGLTLAMVDVEVSPVVPRVL